MSNPRQQQLGAQSESRNQGPHNTSQLLKTADNMKPEVLGMRRGTGNPSDANFLGVTANNFGLNSKPGDPNTIAPNERVSDMNLGSLPLSFIS